MLAKHVEAQVLQHLEIVFHCLAIGRRVETIWPVSLIEGAKLENELSVEQRTLDTIDFTATDSPKCGVAADDIVTKSDGHVVECRRVWSPEIGPVGLECEGGVGATSVAGKLTAISVEDLDLHIRSTVVRGVDSGIDRAICASGQLQFSDVVCRSRLDPNTLPDSTARSVEDVRRIESLLADRNDLVAAISGIMYEYQTVKLSVPIYYFNSFE